jgi:hypothetical protein
MCSIILRLTPQGSFIAANRDEMLARPWEPPAEYWPGIIAGRDTLAGGTWLGLNRHGVAAAVLNRQGSLGPAPGKRSRGELPLLALRHASAAAAAEALRTLDADSYRRFNLIIADATGAYLLSGAGGNTPGFSRLEPGITMLTTSEPNDFLVPRIAEHQPRFQAAPFTEWAALLSDTSGDWETALNIQERNGYGTVCSSLLSLPRTGASSWDFCPGPPNPTRFKPVELNFSAG